MMYSALSRLCDAGEEHGVAEKGVGAGEGDGSGRGSLCAPIREKQILRFAQDDTQRMERGKEEERSLHCAAARGAAAAVGMTRVWGGCRSEEAGLKPGAYVEQRRYDQQGRKQILRFAQDDRFEKSERR